MTSVRIGNDNADRVAAIGEILDRLQLAYSVEKLDVEGFLPPGRLATPTVLRAALPRFVRVAPPPRSQMGIISSFPTTGASHFAIRLRFCAVAAIKNSSLAPLSPRNRNRSSLRMRLR